MAGDSNNNHSNSNTTNNGKPKKRKYLQHSKPVRKGSWPLRPGVQGFFITCDGGRERQATNDAFSLLDTFYEELLDGKDSGPTSRTIPIKPLNKITKFEDSDSSGNEGESPHRRKDSESDKHEEESEDKPTNKQPEETVEESEDKTAKRQCKEIKEDSEEKTENKQSEEAAEESVDKIAQKQCKETEEAREDKPAEKQCKETEEAREDKPAKKHCIEVVGNAKAKSIDELIEDELKEMGDKNKRHFLSLESGCNGCVFIQMHKSAGDPGPASIVQHMMSSAASTRKHMSRFILRVLPAEVTCYASEDEISKAIKPLIEQHFPTEAPTAKKFAVLYEARANTGVDRMKIINAVAKSVPQPHKVDLNKPDKTIIVQIAKTICMVGVAERYRELSKYNLRQLTSPQQ